MGRTSWTVADWDGEVSTISMPAVTLTAANITAQMAAATAMLAELGSIVRGKFLTQYVQVDNGVKYAVGRAASNEAQREEKALVRYYDDTTFERASMELPCVDMTLQNPDFPGVFYLAGAANNDALWEAFVTAFEAYVLPPGGNTAVVEEIIHVGRNI